MINDANQMTQSRLIILLVIIMDLIHNARASIPDTRNTFGFSFSHAKKLTKYAKSAHWIDKNSTEILQHIIDTRILNSTALNKLVESDHNVTIINEPLSVVLNGLDDICHDFRDQIDIQSAKANLNATGPKAKLIIDWVAVNHADGSVDRETAIELFKSMVSECKISCNMVKTNWIASDQIKFFGHTVASIYDTAVRKWHDNLPKNAYNKRRVPVRRTPPSSANDLQQSVQRTRYTEMSKEQYMQEFDAAKNGPLHEQSWVQKEIETYDKAKAKMTMKTCVKFNERRITSKRL
eukprot:442914_1